jgi:Pyocin activator protein PrtN
MTKIPTDLIQRAGSEQEAESKSKSVNGYVNFMRPNTAFLLMAQYNGAAVVPLESVCRDYFRHLTVEKLLRKILRGEIALPIIRMLGRPARGALGGARHRGCLQRRGRLASSVEDCGSMRTIKPCPAGLGRVRDRLPVLSTASPSGCGLAPNASQFWRPGALRWRAVG